MTRVNLTLLEAQEKYTDELEELVDQYDIDLFAADGFAPDEEVYVRDGTLVYADTREGEFLRYDSRKGWCKDLQEYEAWREGVCDGLAAQRTVDWDRGGE